jgi:rubredoxin
MKEYQCAVCSWEHNDAKKMRDHIVKKHKPGKRQKKEIKKDIRG